MTRKRRRSQANLGVSEANMSKYQSGAKRPVVESRVDQYESMISYLEEHINVKLPQAPKLKQPKLKLIRSHSLDL
jgi:hypothetical protein